MNLFGFFPGYETHVYDAGREPAFLMLVAFILTLAGTRFYTRMARSRGWGSASDKNRVSILRYRFNYQQRSLRPELDWGRESKIASTERHASTDFFGLWKSFSGKYIFMRFHKREEKFLSSDDFITTQFGIPEATRFRFRCGRDFAAHGRVDLY